MSVRAQLFITCLGENFFSDTLKDMVHVLERLGVQCEMPEGQTCCGQPFFNSGFQSGALAPARQFLKAFDKTDGYIVAPSGSCVDFVRHHYLGLFPEGTPEHARVKEIVPRTFEFSEFLVNVLKVTDVGAKFPHKVTYHASCHLLRGLGLREEPKKLLRAVKGLELVPLNEEETCCGFGGTFSATFPAISTAMAEVKCASALETKAEYVVSCDSSCLMQIQGLADKQEKGIKTIHLAEVLAQS